ncbi:hypothetical protein BC835DRAFT_1276352 [Cytidiella melzeri]|nr:hypothetical protein BC835DRAFT_1276352 [Cytidiella melzeri]
MEESDVLKLNNKNYEVWCVLMEVLMTRKGIKEVGVGDTPMPLTGPNSLQRVHRARRLATRLALRRTFLTMKKKNDKPMAQWIADVRGVAFRLRGIGVTVDDEELILVLTMGLP